MARDLDIAAPDPRDGRRLEIVVDGLPLFGGAQFAMDTTLSPLHCDGIPHQEQLTQFVSSGPAQGKNVP